jgi:hypothetical protein
MKQNYAKCDSCQNGIIKMTIKENYNDIEVKIYKCSVCRKQHFIKGFQNLEIANELDLN